MRTVLKHAAGSSREVIKSYLCVCVMCCAKHWSEFKSDLQHVNVTKSNPCGIGSSVCHKGWLIRSQEVPAICIGTHTYIHPSTHTYIHTYIHTWLKPFSCPSPQPLKPGWCVKPLRYRCTPQLPAYTLLTIVRDKFFGNPFPRSTSSVPQPAGHCDPDWNFTLAVHSGQIEVGAKIHTLFVGQLRHP